MNSKPKKKIKAQSKQETRINLKLWIPLILAFAALIYAQSLFNGFVQWDDDWYIYENPQILNLSFSSLGNLFASFYNGQYGPLTTLIIGLEFIAGNQQPFLLHFFSLVIHLASAFLVFQISQKLTKNNLAALLVMALFAVHPLQVESVAWISAQKVLLFSFFFLLSLYAYILYQEHKSMKFYALSFLFFVLSFLCKEQAVTLALSIIAVDYWYDRKLISKQVLFEKIPFLLSALIMGIVTLYSTKTGEFYEDVKSYPLIQQLSYSSYALVMYLVRLIVPFNLSAFHPYPGASQDSFPAYVYLFLIPVLFLIYWFFRSLKKDRLFAFSLFFFVANIALVLQVMPLRDFIMADRYVYIPSLAFFLFFVLKFHKTGKNNNSLVYVIIAVCLLFGLKSFQYSKSWENSLNLFTRVVEVYPQSSVGWNNRGLALENLDRQKEAIADFQKSLKYNPSSLFAYNNMAISLSKMGKYQEAIQELSTAISMREEFAQAYYNRADAYSKLNQQDKAVEDYTRFLQLRPDHLKAYMSRSICYARLKKYDEALKDINFVIGKDQNNAEAYLNRGVIYLNTNEYQKAVNDFTTTLKFRPNFNYAYFNRGLAKVNIGDQNGACADLQRAYQLGFKQAGGALQKYCK